MMTLKDVCQVLDAEVLAGEEYLSRQMAMAISSDMMSDVLAFSKSECLLLTGLTNPQSVRTAEMSDISAICYVHGKRPSEECVSLAIQKQIPLLSCVHGMYEACGKLYDAGLRGCDGLR